MSGGSGSAETGASASGERTGLKREIGLWQGTALNVIDMVGVGPFVTLPLILAAMGGQRALGAWLLGALLAICDGLVTAELSASLPEAGGSYAFLREAYGRDRWGRLVSFLFLFQIVFSAPLSIASGALGFARYAGVPAKGSRSSRRSSASSSSRSSSGGSGRSAASRSSSGPGSSRRWRS